MPHLWLVQTAECDVILTSLATELLNIQASMWQYRLLVADKRCFHLGFSAREKIAMLIS